ncbi:MAG: response regulator [Chitinophagaceae bacterium]
MPDIIIFEDDDQLRNSLVVLLGNSNDYTVIGNHADAMDAATIIRRYKPDVVIMDINMPGKTGIQAVLEIKKPGRKHSLLYTLCLKMMKIYSAVYVQAPTDIF